MHITCQWMPVHWSRRRHRSMRHRPLSIPHGNLLLHLRQVAQQQQQPILLRCGQHPEGPGEQLHQHDVRGDNDDYRLNDDDQWQLLSDGRSVDGVGDTGHVSDDVRILLDTHEDENLLERRRRMPVHWRRLGDRTLRKCPLSLANKHLLRIVRQESRLQDEHILLRYGRRRRAAYQWRLLPD